MGACAILPRIIGQSRASELLYTGRFMTAEEGERWGFFSRIVTPDHVLSQAQLLAKQIAEGPTFGNTMTKRMLAMEWAMSVEEAIEAEVRVAVARDPRQAIPLHGTYLGSADAFIGMDISINVVPASEASAGEHART